MSRTLSGIPVHVVDHLPVEWPTHLDDATRIVRHGLADVLEWLGEPVGPKPGEPLRYWFVTEHPKALLIDRRAANSGAVRVTTDMSDGSTSVRWQP